MNMIKAFINARMTTIKPTQTEFRLPSVKPMIWPVRVSEMMLDFPPIDEQIFPNKTLVVPRAFGANAPISDARMDYLSWLSRIAYRNPYPVLSALARYFEKIEDGGSFWDIFIYRHNGDTPIAIFEHFTATNIVASEMREIPPSYRDFIRKCVEYGKGYDPAILNNHLSWKALFMATSAWLLEDEDLMRYAEGMFEVALKQIDGDGKMPLELMRGEKALRYCTMNLEALNAMQWLLMNLDKNKVPDVRLVLANEEIKTAICNAPIWAAENKLPEQNTPLPVTQWAWSVVDWRRYGRVFPCFDGFVIYDEMIPTSYINHYKVRP